MRKGRRLEGSHASLRQKCMDVEAARNKIEIPDADLEPYKSRIKELTKKVGWVIQPEEGGVATFKELSE